MTEADHAALLRLLAAGGASAPRRRLLDAHDSPAAALAAGPPAWIQAGLDATQRRALGNAAAPIDRSLAWLARPGRHLIGWHDPDYPALLRQAPSPPLALFVDGDPTLLWHPGVAVVGSRAPTAGGRDNARAFGHAFAAAGLAVISGLAAGVDAAAHAGALDAPGLTVAVLGSGIDVAYPAANARLHERIAAEGAVVSEHPPGTRARTEFFPARNRIIAGLALASVVIEAAARSGALITARLSVDCGRDVFAIPGSIHNPMARGCHRLIRDGAGLVETPAEVTAALAPMAASLGAALRERLDGPTSGSTGIIEGSGNARSRATEADPNYKRLWQALGHDPTGMDQLVERTGLTPAGVSSMLLVMELEGRVAVAHGRYSRRSLASPATARRAT